MTLSVSEFWKMFLQAEPSVPKATQYQVWFFGNTAAMAEELGSLVLSGTKTATASLLETNIRQPDKAPIEGGYSVVTDLKGDPICVLRTTEIRHIAFKEVDRSFAFDEGEDDQTLASWRRGHWEYFSKEAAELGFDFDENSIVCCERFELLFPK
jgi:uncharacterized protein YhfF